MSVPLHAPRRRADQVGEELITLAHGSGGKAMRDLIDDIFVGTFDNPLLSQLEDQARLNLDGLLGRGSRLALTTDSYVVTPLFFPGGDIGKLAVATRYHMSKVSAVNKEYFAVTVAAIARDKP